jgi:hypothetical protein
LYFNTRRKGKEKEREERGERRERERAVVMNVYAIH